METYKQMKKRHQEEFSKLPMAAAFNADQLEEGKKKLGITDDSEICSLGYGAFTRKSDKHLFDEQFEKAEKELQDAMKDFDFCVGMFEYELGNHEYCITMDPDPALIALGLTFEEVANSKHLSKAFLKAREQYLAGVN